MKKYLMAWIAGSLCLALNAISATVFTNLYTFSGVVTNNTLAVATNFDGANPQAGLIVVGSTLYGTANAGGTNGTGTLFKINTDGTGLTILHQFSDKGTPLASLLLVTNVLYGTTENGGTNKTGSVFKMNTDGTGFTNLYNFTGMASSNAVGVATNGDGAYPLAGLAVSGSVLYGTTSAGGTNGNGTIFRINTSGTGFTNVYNFGAFTKTNAFGIPTNSDGANPGAGLTLVGTTLYGTAEAGGSGGSGTVFAISTNGAGFVNIYSFNPLVNLTNRDGAFISSGLVYGNGMLYGTALIGGTNDTGTVFALSTNGSGFTMLHMFSSTVFGSLGPTNADGSKPGALVLLNNTLYGTTAQGGTGASGTAFSINTNGLGFATLYTFTPAVANAAMNNILTNRDGAFPEGALAFSGNSFYGMASYGGNTGSGNIFVLSTGSIPLSLQPGNNNCILTWGNPAFSLQSSTNLTGPYLPIISAVSPYTNSTSQKPITFFRLKAF